MALTKVKAFEGEAEVLGALHTVSYNADLLTIGGVSIEQAYAVLDKLSTKQIVAVKVGNQPAAPQPKTESQAAKVPQPVAEKPAPHVAAQPPAKVEADELEFPPKDDVPPQPPTIAEEAAGDVPEKIKNATRFIEVLDWVLATKKFNKTQVDEITAACEELRPVVKVVSRVRDLKDKVVSNLAAYSEAGSA